MNTPELFTELVDPAFVVNTETSAVSHYTNFGFDSFAQLPDGRVLAAGPTGLAVLEGPNDAGSPIHAAITTGFSDFKTPQTKRVEAVYFGYTSDGQMDFMAEARDSGHSPTTYRLEERLSTTPRTTRVHIGKGLFGRYWRFTVQNVGGSAFEIHDMAADVATSARRV